MTPRWFQLKWSEWSTKMLWFYDHVWLTVCWDNPILISEGTATREMRNDKTSSPVHGHHGHHGHQHSGWPSQPARVRELAFSGAGRTGSTGSSAALHRDLLCLFDFPCFKGLVYWCSICSVSNVYESVVNCHMFTKVFPGFTTSDLETIRNHSTLTSLWAGSVL